jgi:hypothetical protein
LHASRFSFLETHTIKHGAGEKVPMTSPPIFSRIDRNFLAAPGVYISEAACRLSPEDQQRLRANYRRMLRMSPEERSRLLENYRKWPQLFPAERTRLRRQLIGRGTENSPRPPRNRPGQASRRKAPD